MLQKEIRQQLNLAKTLNIIIIYIKTRRSHIFKNEDILIITYTYLLLKCIENNSALRQYT